MQPAVPLPPRPEDGITARLQRAFFFDNSAGTYTDVTAAVSERGTTSNATLSSAEADVDFLYIGCAVPFRGVRVNVNAANGTASVLVATYRKSDDTWAGLTETDGTASAGAALAIDNTITWTVPTDWITFSVNGSPPLYWVRLAWDGGLDSATTVAELVPLGVESNGPVAIITQVVQLPRYWFNPDLIGGIEATGDNSDTVVVTWLCVGKNTWWVAQ